MSSAQASDVPVLGSPGRQGSLGPHYPWGHPTCTTCWKPRGSGDQMSRKEDHRLPHSPALRGVSWVGGQVAGREQQSGTLLIHRVRASPGADECIDFGGQVRLGVTSQTLWEVDRVSLSPMSLPRFQAVLECVGAAAFCALSSWGLMWGLRVWPGVRWDLDPGASWRGAQKGLTNWRPQTCVLCTGP